MAGILAKVLLVACAMPGAAAKELNQVCSASKFTTNALCQAAPGDTASLDTDKASTTCPQAKCTAKDCCKAAAPTPNQVCSASKFTTNALCQAAPGDTASLDTDKASTTCPQAKCTAKDCCKAAAAKPCDKNDDKSLEAACQCSEGHNCKAKQFCYTDGSCNDQKKANSKMSMGVCKEGNIALKKTCMCHDQKCGADFYCYDGKCNKSKKAKASTSTAKPSTSTAKPAANQKAGCVGSAGMTSTFQQINCHKNDLASPILAISFIVLLPLIIIGFMSFCKSSKKAGGGCFTGCFLAGLIIMAVWAYEAYYWELGPNAPANESMK